MQSPVKVLLQHWFVFQFQSSNFYWRENDSSDSGKLLLLDNHRIYLFQYLVQLFKQQHICHLLLTYYHFHLLGIDFSNLIGLSDSELTSLLSPSGVDSSLTAQGSNNVGLHSQNQRHNTIQMPGPLDAMQTQVSAV